MGFGKPMDETPMLLMPGVLSLAWGSVVRQLAAGLDVELDELKETVVRLPGARRRSRSRRARSRRARMAALRFEVLGMHDGTAGRACSSTSPGCARTSAPDWPQPAGQGCYRVRSRASRTTRVDLQLLGTDGDHNTAGLKATAMRLVNAVEAVVAAPPGLRDRARPAADHRPRARRRLSRARQPICSTSQVRPR